MNGAELVAIHKGRYFSCVDGLSLGPGPFVVGLEYATGKTATVIGKPEKSFFLSALEGLDCLPHQAIMIGDVNFHYFFIGFQRLLSTWTEIPLGCSRWCGRSFIGRT